MRKLTFFCLLFCFNNIYDLEILNKIIISDKITLEFKNKTSKPIFLFRGTIGTQYKITNEKDQEVIRKNHSTWDPEYFRPEISEDLILRTAKRYGIESHSARKWIELKNKYVIINPKNSIKLIIDFDEDMYSYAYELNPDKKYYVEGKINFYPDFVPQKVIDSLENRNIKFIKNPSTSFKILIDKEKFFRKENYNEKWYYIK